MRRTFLLSSLLLLPVPAAPQDLTKKVGQLTIMADPSFAFPGGVMVVRLRRSLGTTYAILNGRRAPFFDSARGPRAIVPVPVGSTPGPATLGIELLTRRGRQRIAMDVILAAKTYAARAVALPDAKRPLLALATGVTDGRRLLLALRTTTPQALWAGAFSPPVGLSPVPSFGEAETFGEGVDIDRLTDSTFGEYHRGLDYQVPAGTPVLAPAPGNVVFAGTLTLTGETLVLDHGQGVVSAFFHLGRIDVHEGDRVEARAAIALSGDTGIAPSPHLHWGVYVHGVAVDPGVFEKLKD